MKNRYSNTILAVSIIWTVLLTSCGGGNPLQPGHEYMPDMYRSKSYETYTENAVFANGIEAQMPVAGTVARGYSSYPYPNTADGYEKAGLELQNPIPKSDKVIEEGKVLYSKFCVHCHGDAGKGDGKVAMNPKYPGPPPPYDGPLIKGLPDGKIFHTLTYGKNNMGSHASQLTVEERWKLVHYVNKLQGKTAQTANTTVVDSTVTKQ